MATIFITGAKAVHLIKQLDVYKRIYGNYTIIHRYCSSKDTYCCHNTTHLLVVLQWYYKYNKASVQPCMVLERDDGRTSKPNWGRFSRRWMQHTMGVYLKHSTNCSSSSVNLPCIKQTSAFLTRSWKMFRNASRTLLRCARSFQQATGSGAVAAIAARNVATQAAAAAWSSGPAMKAAAVFAGVAAASLGEYTCCISPVR